MSASTASLERCIREGEIAANLLSAAQRTDCGTLEMILESWYITWPRFNPLIINAEFEGSTSGIIQVKGSHQPLRKTTSVDKAIADRAFGSLRVDQKTLNEILGEPGKKPVISGGTNRGSSGNLGEAGGRNVTCSKEATRLWRSGRATRSWPTS